MLGLWMLAWWSIRIEKSMCSFDASYDMEVFQTICKTLLDVK